MKIIWRIACTIAFALACSRCGLSEEPIKVSTCQLKADPAAFNHRLVEVTAFASQGFEDFTLYDPSCPWGTVGQADVWLEYGGTSRSGTMYCCGVSSDRNRPKELTVEKISIPLVDDANFKLFDKLIHRGVQQSALVHATLVGRFFSGEQKSFGKGPKFWGGYGHMGCCSLLAVQQIEAVDPEKRDDLDYDRFADQPEISKKGCGYQEMTPLDPSSALLRDQKAAETSSEEWRFNDPEKTASERLISVAKLDASTSMKLKEVRKAQGRYVYSWRPSAKSPSYTIIVSRPYWLSFYALNPKRIPWVVLGVYESSCNGHMAVTRIK